MRYQELPCRPAADSSGMSLGLLPSCLPLIFKAASDALNAKRILSRELSGAGGAGMGAEGREMEG